MDSPQQRPEEEEVRPWKPESLFNQHHIYAGDIIDDVIMQDSSENEDANIIQVDISTCEVYIQDISGDGG